MTSTAPASVPGDLNAIVRCAVGEEEYALAAADAMLVARAEQMSIAMDGALVGRIRHQESNVPVYSLAALFGGRTMRPLADHHIVVSGGANRPIGLLVDRLVRVPDAHGAELLPLPRVAGPQASAWFRGLLRLGGRLNLMLSPEGLDPAGARQRDDTRSASSGTASSPVAPVVSDAVVLFSSRALPPVPARRYAISTRRVGAVLQALPQIPLPGRAPSVAALGCWRDVAVPVLDFTGRRSEAAGHERYLVVGTGGRYDRALVAFAVDGDLTLHPASRDDRPIATIEVPDFVRGVFDAGGEAVALVDPDRLMLYAAASVHAAARVA